MFDPDPVNSPDLWDGTLSGVPADLNRSENLPQVTGLWNNFIDATRTEWSNITNMGGDSCGSPLLQFTRFVSWAEPSVQKREYADLRFIPRGLHSFMQKIEEPVMEKSSKNERKLSRKETRSFYIYNPPSSTIYTERVTDITGIMKITPSHKQYLPAFILPVVEIGTADGIPSVSEVQVATKEMYKLSYAAANNFDTLGIGYQATIANNVTGQAGKKTEIAEFISELNKTNQGGFLGDIFTTIGAIGNQIGL